MKIKELFHLRSQRKRLFQKDSRGLQHSHQCTGKRQVSKITMIIIDYAAAAAAAAKSLQSCPTLCDPADGSLPGSPVPGILQARTRVGCHFLLQCMKVKSEREVTQSCPTLSDPMDCSLPGSSAHGLFQAKLPGPILYLSMHPHSL